VNGIEIINEQSAVRVSKRRLGSLVRSVLEAEGAADRAVTVKITGDREIRGLHRRFFGQNTPTDVIAFNANDEKPAARKRPASAAGPATYLGDVVVSAETAKREHRRYGASARGELERYVVHGVLHLLGFRDKNPRDFRRMRARQERHLRRFGGPRC
jgi:probable rRNA maturation factor